MDKEEEFNKRRKRIRSGLRAVLKKAEKGKNPFLKTRVKTGSYMIKEFFDNELDDPSYKRNIKLIKELGLNNSKEIEKIIHDYIFKAIVMSLYI